MLSNLLIHIAQIKFHVGNILVNKQRIIAEIRVAKRKNADLIIFPEMALTGYFPEDLLFRNDFAVQVNQALVEIAIESDDIAVLLGTPNYVTSTENSIYNAMVWLENGQVRATYRKQKLPNYGVFDEQRYFCAGKQVEIVEYKSHFFALAICEDLWFEGFYQKISKHSKEITILSLNASPFDKNKLQQRHKQIGGFCKRYNLACVYVNLVGGQDELVFDGASFCVNTQGIIDYQCQEFVESVTEVKLHQNEQSITFQSLALSVMPLPTIAKIYQALKIAIQDYVSNTGFNKAIIGLSGGIDSAVTLCLAVDALGAANVEAVMIPFHYTSQLSKDAAILQSKLLSVNYHEIPIASLYNEFEQSLATRFTGLSRDITEENLQARIRGVILMAISNKSNALVLATGNKSEMAVGYCTLYGDMVGAFAPLKDVLKTEVYQLANYLNVETLRIPESVIMRAPSAELAPGQTDQDSLPDYEVLDAIIDAYLLQDLSKQEIKLQGYAPEQVDRVVKLIYQNEYKRRQSAVGPKISVRNLLKDRRYPIVNSFKG